MMKMRLMFSVMSAALLWMACPAHAVIAASTPIDGLFGPARNVVVGRIAAIAADRPIIDVDVVESIRGKFPAPKLRILVVKPEGLPKELTIGGPVVLMVTGDKYAIHMGDRWLWAQVNPDAATPTYRVVEEGNVLRLTFPGRTDSLIKLFKEMRTRPKRLLNSTEEAIFKQIKPLGKLPAAEPQSMVAADFDGDKKPDLLVRTVQGVRLLLNVDGAWQDRTAEMGLTGAGLAIAGDVNSDGRMDVIAGGKLHLNDGGKFRAAGELSLPAADQVLAAGIVDVSGTKRRDVAVLKKDGELLILQNPGADGQAWPAQPARMLWKPSDPPTVAAALGDWGDDGRARAIVIRERDVVGYALAADGPAPADIQRLAGERLGYYDRDNLGLGGAALATLDSNGDGRLDLLAVNDPFGLLLVHRGFGAFFASAIAPLGLKNHADHPVPFRFTPRTLIAAADFAGDRCDDLLVLTEAGELFLVENPPHPKHP